MYKLQKLLIKCFNSANEYIQIYFTQIILTKRYKIKKSPLLQRKKNIQWDDNQWSVFNNNRLLCFYLITNIDVLVYYL